MISAIKGLKNMHIETLQMSDIILVQTELEAKDLKKTYGVKFDWVKVPNGVGEKFLNTEHLTNPLNIEDYIFSIGRIEPRKNQLKIIEAVKELRDEVEKDLNLVLIGSKNKTNHVEYTIRFNLLLKKYPWITYLGKVPYKKVPAYFKFAKVCVSASWFETTGLTLLEALYCGTNSVASSPRAKEILGNYASYCDPWDVGSIKKAIKKEFYNARPVLSEKMRAEYTWNNAAVKTLGAYKKILNK